jgi:hypothetical protein
VATSLHALLRVETNRITELNHVRQEPHFGRRFGKIAVTDDLAVYQFIEDRIL